MRVGADINLPDKEDCTPLFIASREGHVEVVKELVRAGAGPNKAANNGYTPLEVARYQGHSRIVQLLHGAVA